MSRLIGILHSLACICLAVGTGPSSAVELTLVFSFSQTNGATPTGVMEGADRKLYGTTVSGGEHLVGTCYTISKDGTHHHFASFDEATTGGRPSIGPLAQTSDGTVYGTARSGGIGYGAIFQCDRRSGVTPLVLFDAANGAGSTSALALASDGNLYGTTNGGAPSHVGTLFQLSPAGAFSTVDDFANLGETEPVGPSAIVEAPNGALYGTAAQGGEHGWGFVFKLGRSGSLTRVASFDYTSSGGFPNGVLVRAKDGNFYGTAVAGGRWDRGTIFRVTPGGQLSAIFAFGKAGRTAQGTTPQAPLALGSDGMLYGTTAQGGPFGFGTLFRVALDGQSFEVLASFPRAFQHHDEQLWQASDGLFYSTIPSSDSAACGISGCIYRFAAPDRDSSGP